MGEPLFNEIKLDASSTCSIFFPRVFVVGEPQMVLQELRSPASIIGDEKASVILEISDDLKACAGGMYIPMKVTFSGKCKTVAKASKLEVICMVLLAISFLINIAIPCLLEVF